MQFLQDLRHALRAPLKHPGYFLTAVLTLALGIGFNTAIFTVVNAVLLKPLPYADPDRLLVIRERRLPQFPQFSVSAGNFLTWEAESTVFEAMTAMGQVVGNLDAGDGNIERVRGDRVTSGFLRTMGVGPALGRDFTRADDGAEAPRVLILSHALWQGRFGGDPGVLGRQVRFASNAYTIVGVMPAGFAYPAQDSALWVPMAFTPQEWQNYQSHFLSAVARLKPGVRLEQADAELQTIAKRLSDARPDTNKGWEALVFPMHAYLVRNVRTALLVLLGAVALVLLIACVNVANLLLARGASRQRELAIRSALGAGRGRLVRQLLSENLLLGVCGAAAGLLLAGWLLRLMLALVPGAVPRASEITLDRPVLLFTLALSVITPFIFGLLPALYASRTDLRELLASGGRQGASAPARRTRTILVVSEIALALILLTGAGLLIRSFGAIQRIPPGFDPANALIASINLAAADYPEPEGRARFFDELVTRASRLPQVEAAAVAQSLPLVNDMVAAFEIQGRPAAGLAERPTGNFFAVSPDYFAAMGIPLRRGRAFTARDVRGAQRVVIINETLARRHFGAEDPVGQRMMIFQGLNSEEWREVVGVAADVRQYGLTEPVPAQVYEPALQHPYFGAMTVILRSRGADPATLAPELRAVLKDLDPAQTLWRVRTLEEVLSQSIGQQRFSAVLLGVFSSAALLLAAIGLYGVLAYAVGQRRQEIAIRIAHGAARSDILRLVIVNGLAMAAAGIAIGLVGAFVLRSLISGMLFEVSAADPSTYAGVALMLTVVTVAASAVPAWKATRVDPLTALRGE